LAPSDAEKRFEHRKRVLKGACIIGSVTTSEIRCTVRNMHARGAELVVPPEARIPSEFLLYVGVDGMAYRCELRWRRNDRCGVRFLGTEPKPHWHYG